MHFLMKEKSFYKTLAAIALPIALQNVIAFGVQMMDTVMVGTLGDTALSAASLANQPFFVFMILTFGLAGGGAVLISQYWGKGNRDAVRRVMGISLRCIAVAAILFSLVCNVMPETIMRLFSSEAGVIKLGASYLRVVSFSYFFYGLSACYLTSLRAIENVKLSTLIYFVSFFVNVFFNYVFIFGKLGFPELGIVGAATGTIIARVSELTIVIVYILFYEKKIRFLPADLFRRERRLLPDYVRHSVPVVGSELVWGLGAVTQAAIIGHLGETFVAANSIASVLQQLAMVMLFGIGNAAAVVMGKTIGAGKIEEAKRAAKTLLLLSFGMGIVSCGIVLGLRYPMVLIYPNAAAATKELAIDILGVIAGFMLLYSIEITSTIGILRGAGDTKVGFALDAGCAWLIGVPMGYLAGFVWKLPVLLVYLCLRSDVPIKVFLCLLRILRGNYIKNVTRDY